MKQRLRMRVHKFSSKSYFEHDLDVFNDIFKLSNFYEVLNLYLLMQLGLPEKKTF